jgi:hypothetical protein
MTVAAVAAVLVLDPQDREVWEEVVVAAAEGHPLVQNSLPIH